MEENILLDRVLTMFEKEKHNLSFNGFSHSSINFFDDYPVEAIGKWNDANKEWYNDVKKQNFQNFLKPEFKELITDLTTLISILDSGIELDPDENIGKLTPRWTGAIPHYWAAFHTSNKNKMTDIQFFINFCALGIRVGIYTGKYDNDGKTWSRFISRLAKKKEEVFQIVKELESKNYLFVKTNKHDYAMKSDGKIRIFNNSQEMYSHVFDEKEFDIIFRISREKMTDISLITDIMKCFVETRELYEMLQPNNFNKYKRSLYKSDTD